MHIPSKIHAAWLDQFGSTQALAISGGLSNSRVWQVNSAIGQFCLKAWPESAYTAERLSAIHQWIQAIGMHHHFVPRLIPNADRLTLMRCGDHYWECATWLAGKPMDRNNVTVEDSMLAVAALAEMHRSSVNYYCQPGSSPSVKTRIELLRWYQNRLDLRQMQIGGLDKSRSLPTRPNLISTAPNEDELAQLTLIQFDRLQPAMSQQLSSLLQPVQLCWVVRDLHREHILFEEGHISGIIDYGAARIDEPLIDLVRLLGSLWPYDVDQRHRMVRHYQQLLEAEDLLERFRVLDQTSTLLSAMQWLQWLIIDRREFNAERSELLKRWYELLERLQRDAW